MRHGLTILEAPVVSARAERAHSMKNCISVIIAIARLIEGELSPRGRERMDRLHAAGVRLSRLVAEDLCEEPRPACSSARPACVATLVHEVMEALIDRAEQARVHLSTECDGGVLVGDEVSLKEALFNVVANAIEATPSGGQVLVTTTATADEDQVWTIEDAGCGIPIERLSSLGRPFGTSRPGGSGIGFAFTRKVVAEHGGVLHVESAVGGGTIVSVWLPRDARR